MKQRLKVTGALLLLTGLILTAASCDGPAPNIQEPSYPEEALLIPDNYSEKLYYLSSMIDQEPELKYLERSDITFATDDGLNFSDVYQDSRGRIFFSCNYGEYQSSNERPGGIYSIATYDSSYVTQELPVDRFVNSFTIDEETGLCFYSTVDDTVNTSNYSDLYKVQLNSYADSPAASPQTLQPYFDGNGSHEYNGLCLDGQGSLYIAFANDNSNGGRNGFAKYDIANDTVLETYFLGDDEHAKDVTILDGQIYGAVYKKVDWQTKSLSGNRIIQFDEELTVIDTIETSSLSDKRVIGPQRFLHTGDSRWLYFIDENDWSSGFEGDESYPNEAQYVFNRITAIDTRRKEDMVTFTTSDLGTDPGTLQDPFHFYMYC